MSIINPGRKLRSQFGKPSKFKSKRTGDVLDTLVMMIAGLLLPAWLLGHLFLTFYPAPEVVAGATTDETTASQPADDGTASGSSTKSDSGDASMAGAGSEGGALGSGSGSGSSGDSQAELQAMTMKLDSMAQTSASLESEITSLRDTNAMLAQENANLKTKANQHVMSPKPLQPDNSEAMDELQRKYDAASAEVQSMQQRLESTENEKQTLMTEFANTQSRLQETEANLMAAVKKNEEMAMQPDSGAAKTPFDLLGAEEKTQQSALVDEANAKITDLERQIKELNFSLTNTTNAMAERENALRTAKVEVQDILAQNAELKAALNAARTAPATAEPPKEVFRNFVSSKGSVSRMAFIRWEGEDVIVRSFANKKLYRLTMDRFSEADKQYLIEQKR